MHTDIFYPFVFVDVTGGHGGISKSARGFLAINKDGKPIAMCATISGMGNFGMGSALVREHRSVVLPEFQGMGIGVNLVKNIAATYLNKGIGFYSRTKHPGKDHLFPTVVFTAGGINIHEYFNCSLFSCSLFSFLFLQP